MPRFIRYTDPCTYGGEPHKWMVFLNVDFIRKAVWREHDQVLVLTTHESTDRETSAVELKGEEAKEALGILKNSN